MVSSREYHEFTHRDVRYRVCCSEYAAVMDEICRVRESLEQYIASRPAFLSSMVPIDCETDAPDEARRMVSASQRVGVGPMAGVAGVTAEFGVRAGLAAGATEAIVDNGGDVFAVLADPMTLGLFAGASHVARELALNLTPAHTPVAVCSSSGRMGHSLSLGVCDLATVVSRDAALADAAATQAANLVRTDDDIEPALERIAGVEGVDGVLIMQNGRIGMLGRLPPLVRRPRPVDA